MRQVDSAISVLSAAIDQSPAEYTLYMERGKLYHRKGDFDKALNDFTKAVQIKPHDMEAATYIEMIREILNYRYKDLYNP